MAYKEDAKKYHDKLKTGLKSGEFSEDDVKWIAVTTMVVTNEYNEQPDNKDIIQDVLSKDTMLGVDKEQSKDIVGAFWEKLKRDLK